MVRPSESVEDVNVKVSYTSTVTESGDSGLVLIKVDFGLDVRRGNDEGKLQIEIHGTFELSYRIPGDERFSNEELAEFGRVNAVFNAWPYWREYVQASLARMSMPILTIPVFRVLPRDTPEPQDKRRKPKKGE